MSRIQGSGLNRDLFPAPPGTGNTRNLASQAYRGFAVASYWAMALVGKGMPEVASDDPPMKPFTTRRRSFRAEWAKTCASVLASCRWDGDGGMRYPARPDEP